MMNASKTAVLQQLESIVPQRVLHSSAVLTEHSFDPSWHHAQQPLAVVYPETIEEISALLAFCHREKVPVVPFGAGSSIEGQIIPPANAITLDLTRMNQILAIHADDMDCVVQPGVRRKQLNGVLSSYGLFFSVDPGADATIGGMVATRASGTNTVRYGTMRENVLGLTAVLADGTVIHTGKRARKSSAGLDLTRLFIGSEGTLGVVAEVILRLQNVPPAISAAVVSFDGVETAVQAVIRVIRAAIPVARIELLDELSIQAVNQFAKFDYPLKPTLFLEFHGTTQSVTEQAKQVGEIMRQFGGTDFQWTTNGVARDRLWHARHNAYYAALELIPGKTAITTDVCVPISRLADCITQSKADLMKTSLTAPLLGHVGDGNFHLILLIDPNDEKELAEAKAFNQRLVERALLMEGTCTGEHGVGLGKREFLEAELGTAVSTMRLIKQAFDPHDIMNPGKMLLPL